MNRQFKTDGIILKKINFNDADQILTVLTCDRGKISCIAKGCRRLKSKFCGRLETLYEVRLTGFEGRDLSHLDEIELLDARHLFDLHLSAKSALFTIAEITHRLIPDGQQTEGAYPLLLETICAIGKTPDKSEMFVGAYLIKLLTLLGFMAPFRIKTDIPCPTMTKWGAFLQEKPFGEIARIAANKKEYSKLWDLLNSALRDILNSPLKSEAFLRHSV